MTNFAERLKELRTEKKLTMKQLSVIFNVSEMAVSNWESNKRIPNLQMIIEIAKYFGVTVGYLVGTEN